MIHFNTVSSLHNEAIIKLYKSVNWTNYTNRSGILLKGIQNSLYILGAFKEDKLIGLIRIIGDGYTIIYIQDLLVHPNYQQKGIGQKLVDKILNQYNSVRQIVLLADTNEILDNFYQKVGFKTVNTLGLTCHARLNS
ncbi:MAG: GNAT family N-acetyltransferase [Bacteroidota bacterium]